MKYELIRSKRKSVAVCVLNDLTVLVRSPIKMKKSDIEIFIKNHENWIEKQKQKINNNTKHILSDEEIINLKINAENTIPNRVEYYARIMDVKPQSIKIKSSKSRWGSCSYRNSLNFSYRIMLLPDDLIDYIIVHELAHIIEKNHKKEFYDLIFRYMPDYKNRISNLRKIQNHLIQ